ncbi:MAG: PLP-dependent aspartate aminotransferase family protein [Candidatus Tectomicrobia bacterium]|nr:PLP-dependent aspartate aminotransferase family protein [Candidatus Tectomicrobia bacterium]
MAKRRKRVGMSTTAIHQGNDPDRETGAIIPPIFQTSTYVQASPGKHQGYEYTRSHNPTRTRLEDCLAALEQAQFALVTASGLAAATLVMHALPHGSTVICGDDMYGGTYRLFTSVFHNIHRFHFVNTTDHKQLKAAVKRYKPALIWIESPTNPLLKINDIGHIAVLAKQHDALTLVDNTFMSPYFQNPIPLGADIVLHSVTKYLNGHSDIIGGALMTNHQELYDKWWYLQNAMGPSQSPFDSWLVLRGLKTLAVRMRAHEENAMQVAQFLASHSKVKSVIYPGFSCHPQHELAKCQMRGFGGMVTAFLKGGLAGSRRFLETVELFALAESLGGVESLVDHPAIMTHASIPKAERLTIGITDDLVRLSVGIEDVEDLLRDLDYALKKV